MRPIEVFFVALIIGALIGWIARTIQGFQQQKRWILPFVAIVVMLIHFAVEGWRWQLIPVYILALFMFHLGLREIAYQTEGFRNKLVRVFSCLVALSLVGASIALAVALPVPQIPEPGGAYAIGTIAYDWIDTDRNEIYSTDPDEPRRIAVQIWYPAASSSNAQPAPWISHFGPFSKSIGQFMSVPAAHFFFSHLRLTKTHALEAASASEGSEKFPLILYSHGWTAWRSVALDEIERLVSHGYVVAAPDHSYGAIASMFPDGTVVPNNPKAMPPKKPEEERQEGIEKLVDSYAGDLYFILDQMEQIESGGIESPLKGRVDLDKIGLFGHSTGGGAVTEGAFLEKRAKAVLALDPWVEPVSADAMTEQITVPYMSIQSQAWADKKGANTAKLAKVLDRAQGPVYDLYVRGTAHHDFTLAPLLFPYAHLLGISESQGGYRTLDVVNDYLLGFFDHYLKDKPVPYLDAATPAYPEMAYIAVKNL